MFNTGKHMHIYSTCAIIAVIIVRLICLYFSLRYEESVLMCIDENTNANYLLVLPSQSWC